jgi:hypothetical protein
MLSWLVLCLSAIFLLPHCWILRLFYSSLLPIPRYRIDWFIAGVYTLAAVVAKSKYEYWNWPSCVSAAIPPSLFCSRFVGKIRVLVYHQSTCPHCRCDQDLVVIDCIKLLIWGPSKRSDPLRYEWWLQLSSMRFNRLLHDASTVDIWCNPRAAHKEKKQQGKGKNSTQNLYLLHRS